METIRRSLRLFALPLAVAALAACGAVQTAACGLLGYGTEIQADLNELLALDPALVAATGTPENAAALAAIDSLDTTRAEGQAALDEAAEDEVGPVVRAAFQAALDATAIAATNLRAAVDSGDPATVTDAMGDVRIAADAIDTFLTTVEGLEVECGEAVSSASQSVAASPPDTASPTASAVPTASPSPTAVPTLSPTPEPSPSPTSTPSPTPEPTPTPTPTPSPTLSPTPTPSPTHTPTPSPTATPTPSPSPTASASATPSSSPSATESPSPEPSPSPGAEPGDQGPGPLPLLAGLALLAVAAGGVWVWYQSQKESTGKLDTSAEGQSPDDLPPDDLPPGGAPPSTPR